MDTRTTVRSFFGDALAKEQVADGDSLLMSGLIDSLKMMDLIEYLENAFSVKVDEDELMPENFDSIDAIVDFLQSKTTA